MNKSSKVFVSYSRQDKEKVLNLVELFRANGVEVWIDESSINASSVWAEQIVKAIDNCDLFVLFLSPSSVSSENVSKEVGYAGGTNKRILPVKIVDVAIPPAMLYHLNTIHFIETKHTPPEKLLQHLFNALGRSGDQKLVPPKKSKALLPVLVALTALVGAGAAIWLSRSTQDEPPLAAVEPQPAALVAATTSDLQSATTEPEPAAATSSSKKRVAILYFDDNTSERSGLQPLSTGLALMLIGEVANFDGYEVVERADLQKVINELDLTKTGRFDPSTTAQIGKLLGAESMVVGSYMNLMGKFRIDARMIDVETGSVMHAASVSGEPDSFDQLGRDLATKLFSTIGHSSPPQASIDQSLPLDAAARLGEALQLADEGKLPEASAKIAELSAAYPESNLVRNARTLTDSPATTN
jgi:curli biogenesis system outer membrane secretion channel CsgG